MSNETNTPTKPNPPPGISLKLSANKKGVSWCLERLQKDMHGRKTKTLGIFQAVPLYYAALAVKRDKKMSIPKRNAAVISAYKYASGAFLEWLQEIHDFRAPSWLTVGVMGCTTLSPQGEKEKRYFDAKRDTTWNRFADMQRTIRSQWMPWVNEYVVNSQSSQGSLPSGTQEEDMWEALHSFLWQQTANSKKKMTREGYQRRSGAGCIGDVIGTSTAGSPVAQEADGVSVKETEGETVTCRVPMPESWLHTYSLAFACFGRFSDHPDPDINLSMSDGPPEATSESTLDETPSPDNILTSSDSSLNIGGSWKKPLRGRNFPDETLSRAHQKRVKRQERVKSERIGLSTRLAEAIEKVATDTSEKDVLSAVLGIKSEMSIANNQRKRAMIYSEREREIGWLFQEIALRKDIGDDEGKRKAQARLLKVMETPIGGEEVQSVTAGQGSDDTALVQNTKGTAVVLASRDTSLGTSGGGCTTLPTGGGNSTNEGVVETENDAVESTTTPDKFYDLGETVEEEDVIDITS